MQDKIEAFRRVVEDQVKGYERRPVCPLLGTLLLPLPEFHGTEEERLREVLTPDAIETFSTAGSIWQGSVPWYTLVALAREVTALPIDKPAVEATFRRLMDAAIRHIAEAK
jgi:hypothetical protein